MTILLATARDCLLPVNTPIINPPYISEPILSPLRVTIKSPFPPLTSARSRHGMECRMNRLSTTTPAFTTRTDDCHQITQKK
jgi:hypothetical protein